MSMPPASEYLGVDFDTATLRVPQLRSILLEHDVTFPSGAKKADLLELFEMNVRSQADIILGATARVRPSRKGITVVPSDMGSETASMIDFDSPASVPAPVPAKRRGRPRKTVPEYVDVASDIATEVTENEEEPEVEPEPPAKKPRGRPRKTAPGSMSASASVARTPSVVPPTPSALPEPVSVILGEPSSPRYVASKPAMTPKKRGRPRKSEAPTAETSPIDDGANAEMEDEEVTPAPPSARSRHSLNLNAAAPEATTSAPSSSRRQTIAPRTSEKPRTDTKPTPRAIRQRRSASSMEKSAEVSHAESEQDEVEAKPKHKTPKREKDDPAFSDFNPFQSGSEEAAARERRRRKSSMGLVKTKPSQPRFSEPAPSQNTPPPQPPSLAPELSQPIATPGILRRVGPSRENLRTPPAATREEMLHEKEIADAQQYNGIVSDKLGRLTKSPSKGGENNDDMQITVRSTTAPRETSLVHKARGQLPVGPLARSTIPLSVLLLLLLSLINNYKSQSSSLGFCDSNSSTNNLVLNRENALDNARSCVARRAVIGVDDPNGAKEIDCDVSALPLVPFLPRPTACAICPAHAVCENGELIACEPEYILSPNPLSFIAGLTDGLPGLAPRSFPPTCRPDTAKKRMVGGLAMQLEKEMAITRGNIVCAGSGQGLADGRKGDGERFGVTEQALRETFNARRDPKISPEQFEEIFEAALTDLVEHEDVIESIDINGISWYAAARTELTLACRGKMEAMDLVARWKSQLGSTAAVLATIAWIRSTMKQRQEEKQRAEELVNVVLKRLQDQERLHYSDPAVNPSPFIPPAQLRDLVIPPTGSSTYRNRLWTKVNDLIEANANVAVREQEVRGELWKTWEWQGVGQRHVTWDQ